VKNKIFILAFLILAITAGACAQVGNIIDIRGASIRFITIDDSTRLKTIAGNATAKQGNTTLYGDSIVQNERTNILQVFGNVHINDADSVHTYSNYLRYLGNERKAFLKTNVKLTDGKAILTTQDLEYDVSTGIAKYFNGGKVINGATVLTSNDATYYSDTKDVFFQKNVVLKDPKYFMRTDSLRYNTQFKNAYINSPTKIRTDKGQNINTSKAIYSLETSEVQFLDRTLIEDSTFSAIADKIYSDDKKGVSILEGNAKYVDSVNNIIVLGGMIESNNKTKSFLATRKPVVVLVKDKDSTYIAADTLFSGLRIQGQEIKKQLNKTTAAEKDTMLLVKLTDSINAKDFTTVDTVNNKKIVNNKTDSVRYVIGYNHVRIYNDSVQAACDSMYYSTEDSIFRMFRNPIVWKEKNQVTADTMYLFTENQKPKRVYAFNNALVVNKINAGMYNQAAGRTLNAYFVDGKIQYVRIKAGPAETVFYPQAEDSSFTGMNRCSGDALDIYFVNEEMKKIKFIRDVNGTLYPIQRIPEDKRKLKNFIWDDKRRPKNKLELFE
jgi:lipopolysaccharide export system protein LptA